jgi:hypothetical protein
VIMQPLLANMGLPMLILMLPAFVVGLPVVIAIEAWVVARQLELEVRASSWPVALANIVSTLVGIPVAWFLVVVLEMIIGVSLGTLWPDAGTHLPERLHDIVGLVLQAGWLGMGAEQHHWLIPGAALVLLVPFCAASVGVEGLVVAARLPEVPPASIYRAVLRANLVSYAGFAIVFVVWLIRELLAA